jgi:hypothetical protein
MTRLTKSTIKTALLKPGLLWMQTAAADEFSKDDLKRWEQQFMETVK